MNCFSISVQQSDKERLLSQGLSSAPVGQSERMRNTRYSIHIRVCLSVISNLKTEGFDKENKTQIPPP